MKPIPVRKCDQKFFCTCKICQQKAIPRPNLSPIPQTDADLSQYQSKDFLWLLETLGSASSLKVNIPQTVGYINGKAAFILKTKDHQIKFTTSPQKLHSNQLMKRFMMLARSMKKGRRETVKNQYKDVALIRFNDLVTVKVMNEIEFMNLMYQRPGSPIWKKLYYLQSLVKVRSGVGECIIQQSSKQKDNLVQGIIETMKTINWQVPYVKAEFQKDDDGKFWLFNLDSLYVKKLTPKPVWKMPPLKMSQKSRQNLNQVLDYHEPTERAQNLQRLMTANYERVRRKTRIDDMLNNSALVELPCRTPAFRERERKRRSNYSADIDPRNSTRRAFRLAYLKSPKKFMINKW